MHAPATAAPIRIGTQGWNYDAWVGPFYPTGTRAAEFLGVYARAFDTVEVDSTFYAIPPTKTVRAWAERTPPGFKFALKLPQEITHERRLRPDDDTLSLFFDRARELEDRLGPVLVQLAPDFGPSELPALAKFLDFWEHNLDGKVHRVRVANAQLIKPAEFRFSSGLYALH